MPSATLVTFDFFVDLYNKGFHKIIEDIILALDAKSILACLDVNYNWCKIILFYCKSGRPKFQNQQDLRITEEWWKKSPVIYKIALEEFNIYQLKFLHIIGNENEVLIAVLINGSKTAKIILIDSKNLFVLNFFSNTSQRGWRGCLL